MMQEDEAGNAHPPEMRAAFSIRCGERKVIGGQARMTPAGVISAGPALSAVLPATGFLVRAARRRV